MHGGATLGKYEYLRIFMGLCNNPVIFLKKMSGLMEGLKFARAYPNELLLNIQENYDVNLEQLEQMLTRLSEAGL